MQQQCLSEHKMFTPSDVWVDNLAHKEYFFCGALSNQDHKWSIELQHRDVAEGQKCDADACRSCSGGSGLIDIQSGFVHNLGVKWWQSEMKGR